MTKFKEFLNKYGIDLREEKSKRHGQTFSKWEEGEIDSPGTVLLDVFYELYKGQINFDKKGLMDCFKLNDKSSYYTSPFILGIEGGINREYFYLFTNYLLNNVKSKKRVLVIDEAKYSYIYDMLGKPYNKNLDIFKITKLGKNKDKLLTTNHQNIDYINFLIHEPMDTDYEKINQESLELYRTIKGLIDYDLVIINYREHSQGEIICKVIRQVCDQVYHIRSENKYEKSYDELNQQINHLEMLKTFLNYKVAFASREENASILKNNKDLNYFKYLKMTKEILGLDENAETYHSILEPRVYKDLNRLYQSFRKTCFFRGFQEEDCFSGIGDSIF